MVQQLLCLGGPLHGAWQPSDTPALAAYVEPALVRYGLTPDGAVAYAAPAPPVLYLQASVDLPGWRMDLWCWVTEDIANGAAVPAGLLIPGGIVSESLEAGIPCRWCYGRAMPDYEVCSRVACITYVGAIESLDVVTADDAANWPGSGGE